MPLLQDIVLSSYYEYPRRKDFNLQTNCVTSLYLHELGKVKTPGLKKIIVQVAPEAEPQVERMADVCMAHLAYDLEAHWKVPVVDRKRLMLGAIQRGVLMACEEYGLGKQQFVDTYEKLAETDLQHVREWGKPVRSPDGTRYARVRYYYDVDSVRIFVRVWRKGNEISGNEVFLVSTPPHELRFVPILGKLAWKDDTTISLTPKKAGLPEICARV